LTIIREYAFFACGVTSIIIPDSVTTIEQDAFGGCSNLASISLSNSLTFLAIYAFRSTKITSITIPASLDGIGGAAFQGCSYLETINLLRPSSQGITSGTYLFQHTILNALTTIYVPDDDSVTAYKEAPGWSAYAAIIKKAGT
jgi:hypothetical protein